MIVRLGSEYPCPPWSSIYIVTKRRGGEEENGRTIRRMVMGKGYKEKRKEGKGEGGKEGKEEKEQRKKEREAG